ncbi:MAG: GntR family transcriptional regulator [Sphingobacterium composti]|uniref:GntR family transcriptional regulator n=1 Tax=Sphingobacterium composti TaxID=363260 RepID=UPI001F167963|nr:GntR family transcriptional regulator [Sphingobacterium composti Ten et al. 2007 non Yoo et al. 2007]
MMKVISEFLNSIEISDFSATPKYQQLVDSIIEAIQNKQFRIGDLLPSINEVSMCLEVSRDTVEKAYKHLKNSGIISSTPGKGYFVAKNDVVKKLKIAIFLNKLSAHKKIVYDAFVKELGEEASIDLFVYHSDISLLRRLFQNLNKPYDRYVIFPHFKEGRDQAPELLSLFPQDKLILLGKHIDGIKDDVDCIYENYENDIYDSLEKIVSYLSKYDMIKLIFPNHSDYPKAIIKGFYKLCSQYALEHILVGDLSKERIKSGECYISLTENDLVLLLEKTIDKKYEIGKDIGVISYNETALKKFILNGIATISTDFELMGRYAAQIIKNNEKKQIEVPFYVNVRPSIFR